MKRVSLKFGDPMPKTIGRCADAYKEVSDLRLAMQKEVDTVKKRETEINEHILENLSASDDTGASGLKYKAQIKTSVDPSATDWEAIHDFVYENDRFDILGKKLNKKAIEELWDAGKKVPGVVKINVKKVSITKI